VHFVKINDIFFSNFRRIFTQRIKCQFITKRQSKFYWLITKCIFKNNEVFRNKSVKFGSPTSYVIHFLSPNSFVITLKFPKRIRADSLIFRQIFLSRKIVTISTPSRNKSPNFSTIVLFYLQNVFRCLHISCCFIRF